MPKYLVYDTKTGDVVRVHETIDAVSGASLPCTPEEVLGLIEDAPRDQRDVIEYSEESTLLGHSLRVDTKTALRHETWMEARSLAAQSVCHA
jgi:hypothetical protein